MTNTTDEIKVSVMIISYKHAPYIRKCLDSILCQKVNFRYEVIVGDDCSNDGTKEILEEYQKKYPNMLTVVINEKNLGPSRNSLNLEAYVKGKYVCRMESDDFWVDVNRLQKQVDFLDAHPEYSAVGGNHYAVDSSGKNPCVWLMRWQVNKTYKLKDFLRYGYIIHGNTLMFRRNLPTTQEEFERYVKLRLSAPTMGDIISRSLMYDKGKIFVLPDLFLAHRDGSEVPTSFFYQSSRHMLDYIYMYCRIVYALNEYFKGKYNFNPLIAARNSSYMYYCWRAKKKLYSTEFCQYMRTLPMGVRLLSYERLLERVVRRICYKFGMYFHLYIDNQEARAFCK